MRTAYWKRWGESSDVPKYYRSVVKSMWSVAQNMRMYSFIKDADLQAVYKTIPDMKLVALRNRMEGKKTGAVKEIQIETEKVVEVQIAREDRRENADKPYDGQPQQLTRGPSSGHSPETDKDVWTPGGSPPGGGKCVRGVQNTRGR